MINLVLFDLDGTLADDRHRIEAYKEGRFDEYFSYENQMSDPVFEQGRELLRCLQEQGWVVGYLTARMDRNHRASLDWLSANGFPESEWVFHRSAEYAHLRPPEFKSLIVGALIASGEFNSVALVDNDPEVIAKVSADNPYCCTFHATWDQEQ